MSAGLAEMIAAICRGYSSGEMCEVIYATWLGDRLRVDSLPMDIPSGQVDIDERLLEHTEVISMTVSDESTGHGAVNITEQEVKVAARLKAGDKVLAVKMANCDRYAIIGIYEKG